MTMKDPFEPVESASTHRQILKNLGVDKAKAFSLASIAISLKRIADLLEEADTDRRIGIAAQQLSET